MDMKSRFEHSQRLLQALDYDLRHTLHPSKIVSLWRLIQGYHGIYIAAILCLGGAAVARAGAMYLLRYFVDTVLLASERILALAPWYALGFVLLAVVQGGASFLAGTWANQAAEGACCRLRNYLYNHMQHLSFTFHDQNQTGDLLQRVTSDVEAIRKLFAANLSGLGRTLTLMVVYLTGMFMLHGRLTWIALAVLPAVVAMSFFFFPRIEQRYADAQKQEARLSTRLQENLSGVRVVRAFVRQAFEEELTEKENAEFLRHGRRVTYMHAAYWPVSDILASAQIAVCMFLGARMVIADTMTLGTFLAFTGMLGQLMFPIRNLGRMVTQISMGWVSFVRIARIIRAEPEAMESMEAAQHPPALAGDVQFQDVEFAYEALPEEGDGKETEQAVPATEQGPVVLHGISLHAQPGEVVAILGSTGSGKSTLVSLIPRFYEHTAGEIRIDGIDLRRYAKSFIRRHVGIVQQDAFLFSTTIRENLLLGVGRGRNIPDDVLHAAARAAYIHDAILEFPEGYDTMVGEKGVTLSGGQKQRLSIARTLLKDPRILIMDDALSAVDFTTESHIRAALQTLMESRTTFIIGHRIQSIMHADQILVLDKGRIVQQGRHEALIEQPGLYRDVYRIQIRIEEELQEELGLDGVLSQTPNGTALSETGAVVQARTGQYAAPDRA